MSEVGYPTIEIGGIITALISEIVELQLIVENDQMQCVLNTLKNWVKEGKLSRRAIEPTVPNETIRPAISAAYGVFDKNVSLPDIFGHGILVKTKGSNLLYIG